MLIIRSVKLQRHSVKLEIHQIILIPVLLSFVNMLIECYVCIIQKDPEQKNKQYL